MAEPIMTASDPSQYREQLNQILYSKNQYNQGVTQQNQGLKNWAQSNAQQYYSQLPQDLMSQVQGMNASALQSFYDSLFNSPTPGANTGATPAAEQWTPPPTPYDAQMNDLLERMTGKVDNPTVNPWDAQMEALLSQLTGLINTPLGNVEDSPLYAAAQARLGRQQQNEINTAADVLGGSGLARSSVVTDRAQNIAQQFTDYMETQIIPQIAAQIRGERDSDVANLGQLLNATGQQQGVFDERSKQELQGLATLYDAITGQQGRFDQLMQNNIQNQQRDREIGIDEERLGLEQDRFKHQQVIDNATLELQRIDSAMTRTQMMGSVSREDAEILGVPAGTPTFQAANAVAQRKHELEIQQKEASAAMARTQAQIAGSLRETQLRIQASKEETQMRIKADKEAQALARQEANKGEDYRLLISIWDQTGKAPPGLEKFGVSAGTPKDSGPISPQQALAQIELDQVKADQTHRTYLDNNTPAIQKQYGVDKQTAEVILGAFDNPTKEAALADLKSQQTLLQQMGVDTKKVKLAIIGHFDAKDPSGKTTSSTSTKSETIYDDVDPTKLIRMNANMMGYGGWGFGN